MAFAKNSENSSAIPRLVKEGLLRKRGETIRTWRPRYFYLYEDGSFLGFKGPVDNPLLGVSEPLNSFTVQGCQIFGMDRPKPFTFMISGRLDSILYRTLERFFCTETQEEWKDWLDSIEKVLAAPGGQCQGQRQDRHSRFVSIRDYTNVEDEDWKLWSRFQERRFSNEIGKVKLTFDNFEFLHLLGVGSFGKVVLCRDKNSGNLYAMKVLKKAEVVRRREVDHTLTENFVLQKVQKHPFLLSLKCSFQTSDRLCFVTEFANGGDLYFHLQRERYFSEEKAKFYAAEIGVGIGYLHQLGIIYRDLKLENILLDSKGHIKIADFGLCKEGMSFDKRTHTFCGTAEYFAPELLHEEVTYGVEVDWWGLGVVIYEMMTGKLPFGTQEKGTQKPELFTRIANSDVVFPPTMSSVGVNLLEGLLAKIPTQRLGSGPGDVKEVMSHAFFATIDWNALVQKKLQPPYRPQLESDVDLRYFDATLSIHPPLSFTTSRDA